VSWTEHGKGKIGRCSVHESGWMIENCGHPTATWPWSATSPLGEPVVAWHGHAWRTLAEAKRHVEALIVGERVLSTRFRGPARAVRIVEMTDEEALEVASILTDEGAGGCVAYVAGGRIRFVGRSTGEHSLDIWASSRARVEAHWEGYAEPGNTARAGR